MDCIAREGFAVIEGVVDPANSDAPGLNSLRSFNPGDITTDCGCASVKVFHVFITE